MGNSHKAYTTPSIRTLESGELLERLGPQAGGSPSGLSASTLDFTPGKTPVDRVLNPPSR